MSSLVEQMFLISKHKRDVSPLMRHHEPWAQTVTNVLCGHMHYFSQTAKLTSCPEMVVAWHREP